MTEYFLSLVTSYGVWALALTTFLSCLALPVTASLAMLAAGGFVAAEELPAVEVVLGAFLGAVIGDQVGFGLGRFGSGPLARLAERPKRGAMLRRATEDLKAKGVPLVFFSRWLVSPLGPYVNLAAGAMGMAWRRFVVGDLAGEAVWVLVYVGLGYLFAGNIAAVADILGSLSGLFAALAVAAAAGVWLFRAARQNAQN